MSYVAVPGLSPGPSTIDPTFADVYPKRYHVIAQVTWIPIQVRDSC